MKKVLFLMLFSCSAYAQEAALVHINAEFNKSNDWYGLHSVSGTKVFSGYLESNAAIKQKYNITKVPTLILYSDGKEIKRWEGGLDMKLNVNPKIVQWEIDKL